MSEEQTDFMGKVALLIVFVAVGKKIFEWVPKILTAFWQTYGHTITWIFYLVLCLAVLCLAIYLLIQFGLYIYEKTWVQIAKLHRAVKVLESKLNDVSTDIERVGDYYSDLPHKVETLGHSIVELSKFTGLEDAKKVEEAKDKIQKKGEAKDVF